MNITDTFIDTLFEMMSRQLPADVEDEARKCLLDQIGATIAGSHVLRADVSSYLDLFSAGGEEAGVVGLGRKTSLQRAALVNGMFGHAFDIDDGQRFSFAHLGASIISALLAVAEYERLELPDLLRGVAIGYEATIRLGRAVQPAHRNRGFHVSGTCGTVGSALGVAAALGFDRVQMKTALAAAVTSAAGILEMQEDCSTLKPFNLGRAAQDGISAAYIARAGFVGPEDPLGGERGFLRVYADTFDAGLFSIEADGAWNIKTAYHKPYAACRHCHAPIDAALRALLESGASFEDIDRVVIRTYREASVGHLHTDTPSVVSAKMSIPFSVAIALKTGSAGPEAFTEETIADPEIASLLRRTKSVVDPELTALVPGRRPAVVELGMRSGERFEARVDFALGEPENPMPEEVFRKKFFELARFGGKDNKTARCIERVILEDAGPLSELWGLLGQ